MLVKIPIVKNLYPLFNYGSKDGATAKTIKIGFKKAKD
jgi:hypothetical protein